jgi:hypothetical protein
MWVRCQNFFKDEDGAGAAENGEGLAAEQAEDSSGDAVAQKWLENTLWPIS